MECQQTAEKYSALNVKEMDMSNPMNELDKLASGLEKLSIRKPIKYGSTTKYSTKGIETEYVSLGEAVENSKKHKSKMFLEEANDIIYGKRAEDYGDAIENFTNIANMWTHHKRGYHFTKEDVAIMMIMVKIARCHHKITADSLKDIVGYCTILHRFQFIDGKEE